MAIYSELLEILFKMETVSRMGVTCSNEFMVGLVGSVRHFKCVLTLNSFGVYCDKNDRLEFIWPSYGLHMYLQRYNMAI